MEIISTQMVIDMKVIGIMTYKMVLEHTIIQMVIFTKANGLMESLMEKETIFIMEIKEYIKEIGKMEKKKDLESLSLMINMDIQENGEKTKKMEKDHIFIQMAKDIKDHGSEIRKRVKEFTDIKTEMLMKVVGKKIEDMVLEL